MNALLIADWPFLLAFIGGALLGIAVGWLLRSWWEPAARRAAKQPANARAAQARPAERHAMRTVTAPESPIERHAMRTVAAPARARECRLDAAGRTAGHELDDDALVASGAPTVLLIDDRLEMLGIHAAYLRRHGYRTLLADSGTTGLAFARQYHPALIVLDHSMPDRTGVEVARELKADASTAHIPILLMTALSYGAVGAAAMEAGCEAYLSKPIEPSRLLREIEARTRPPQH